MRDIEENRQLNILTLPLRSMRQHYCQCSHLWFNLSQQNPKVEFKVINASFKQHLRLLVSAEDVLRSLGCFNIWGTGVNHQPVDDSSK